jgi:acyl carrier protein
LEVSGLDSECIKQRLYALANEFYKEVRDPRAVGDLVTMYSANSIDCIEFLLLIEDEYSIEFDDDKLNMQTLMDIEELVELIITKAGLNDSITGGDRDKH